MDSVFNLLHYAASFFVILSAIVFVHEFGHYLIAKMCGVRVEAFSIGFGRELLGWTDRSGTRWKISLLPLGGYVKMFGDADPSSRPDQAALDTMSDADKKVAFQHKSLPRKAAIVMGGPLANFILTIVILTGFILTTGLPTTQPIVGEIIKNTPAERAGLMPGDRILRVGGREMKTFNDIPRAIATNLGTPVELELERGGQNMRLMITPESSEDKDALGNSVKRPLIGFKSQEIKYRDVGLPRAVWEAVTRTYEICETTLEALGQMITGQRGADDLKGPLGIAKLTGQATEKSLHDGSASLIFWLIAMLSANLGLVNLLPVPLLDGGHLMFYGVEALRGKPMAVKFQEYSYRIGFTVLALLMAFTLVNDMRKLF